MLNNAWPSLAPNCLPPPLIPFFPYLLHLPVVGSSKRSSLHPADYCRVKLRLAKQGDGSRASETNREGKRERVLCHCMNGVTNLSTDLSEWALELYHFGAAIELDCI